MPLLQRRITPAYLAANRRNAQKSTGPRTLEGKRQMRLNALKHGLRSRSFRQSIEKSGQEAAKFDYIAGLFLAMLRPTKPWQARLVARYAQMIWSLRRRKRMLMPARQRARLSFTPAEEYVQTRFVKCFARKRGVEAGSATAPALTGRLERAVAEAGARNEPTKPLSPLESTKQSMVFAIADSAPHELPHRIEVLLPGPFDAILNGFKPNPSAGILSTRAGPSSRRPGARLPAGGWLGELVSS